MKQIFLFILVSLIAVSVSAQKKLTFGPKAGISIVNLHADNAKMNNQYSGVKSGFVAGAFVEYRTMKWLAVSADVLFVQKGAENESGVIDAEKNQTETDNYKLNYIDVPVLANFYIAKGLALKAGIQPSFLLSAKNHATVTTNGETVDEKFDLKAEMNKVEFSIPVGVSYTFRMGLVLDLRYNISCTNILKDADYKMTNRVATLTVGWKF